MDDGGRISRRALLLGGAGVVAAGGIVAANTNRLDRVLYRVGLLDSPNLHAKAPGAAVRVIRMPSAAMGRTVPVGISAPDDVRGVVICLHGRNGTYKMPFDLEFHRFVADADAPLAVVGVNGGLSSYWHKRATGVDPQAMLHQELLPLLARELGPNLPLAIMGWSMGGYGALLAAVRHPKLYKVVVGVSPALFTSPAATSPGAFDDAEDYRRNDVFASVANLAGMTVRLDCGTGDPFIDATRAFAATLPKQNVGTFGTGLHDAGYWHSVAPAQIETIRGALGL